MTKPNLKTYSLEEITDKHIGKRGTPKREAFEMKIILVLSLCVKNVRHE